jgi:DNA primase
MASVDDPKERIREAIPIEEVIGETIALTRQGHGWVGAH